MKHYATFLLIIALCLTIVFLPRLEIRSEAQTSDTCSDGKIITIDTANKRYKCMLPDTPMVYRTKSINLNAGANTDSGSAFTGLPAKYLVLHLWFDNSSGTPTLATEALRTAASGAGTAIVTAQALSTLSAANITIDSTLAVTTTQTAGTLYIRNVAAAGSAMTADATLEVIPLN